MESSKNNHSVKVPRLYKVAARTLSEFRAGSGSLKSLVYENKRHPNVKAIFSLLTNCINNENIIQELMTDCSILKEQTGLDPTLASILITELLWGKGKLAGESKPVITVLKYEEALRSFSQGKRVKSATKKREAAAQFPRYVRINRVKTSLSSVLQQFKSDGFVEVAYDKETTDYETYLDIVKNLAQGEFLMDFHVSNLVVFPSGTHFYDHFLYQNGTLMLQDKASCLPVEALNPSPGSVVLDACAAPGMKTTQIVSALSSKTGCNGSVIAVERDGKRFLTLQKILKSSGAEKYVQVFNSDFLLLEPKEFDHVDHIILDPSCSGSGMSKREGDADMSDTRLKKLSSLQTMLLKHALNFPSVKTVAYSTCSISEEENEKVVEEVLSTCKHFKAIKCLPTWERRGSEGFKHADKFIRTNGSDLCNGFFLALLQRKKLKT